MTTAGWAVAEREGPGRRGGGLDGRCPYTPEYAAGRIDPLTSRRFERGHPRRQRGGATTGAPTRSAVRSHGRGCARTPDMSVGQLALAGDVGRRAGSRPRGTRRGPTGRCGGRYGRAAGCRLTCGRPANRVDSFNVIGSPRGSAPQRVLVGALDARACRGRAPESRSAHHRACRFTRGAAGRADELMFPASSAPGSRPRAERSDVSRHAPTYGGGSDVFLAALLRSPHDRVISKERRRPSWRWEDSAAGSIFGLSSAPGAFGHQPRGAVVTRLL